MAAGFGWDAAHREWFYGFRLAVRTDLGSRLVRAWGIVPPAVDERVVADILPAGRYASLVYTGIENGIAGNAALLNWGAARGLVWDEICG